MSDTVFVLDDDASVRRSMSQLFKTVGIRAQTFGSTTEFLERIGTDAPGCAIVDIRLPEMSGLELQTELNRRGEIVPIIIITGYGDIPTAVQCLKAGAVDFFEKPVRPQMLLDRVQQLMAENVQARARRAEQLELRGRLERLTPREREVIDLVINGKTSVQIARQLCRSPKTIHVHRAEAMAKMNARSVAELGRLVVLALGDNAVDAG